MKHIPLPKKFTVEESVKGKKAKVVIEPCFSGYGLTLGNALRRVLLSSLPGGAVNAVKIKGVQHEFSSIDNVSEDVVDIILNLKQLRVKVYGNESVSLKLKVKGEKKITAGDFELSSDAEIINKDLIIATQNDKDAEFEMEIVVSKGVGYVPTEDRVKTEKAEIGFILVDSIFTPVVAVGLEVEAARVGQKTDFDRIVLDVETDGTITPEEAVQKSAEILVNQFTWIMDGGMKEIEEVELEAPVKKSIVEIEAEEVEEKVEEATETEEVEATPEKPKRRGRPKKGEVSEE